MTNEEKFKTVKERTIAFRKFCTNKICKGRNANCILSDKIHDSFGHKCEFAWLNLEYKEELKECPFCGGEPVLYKGDCSFVKCHNCDAESFHGESSEEVIAAWNRRVS